MKTDNSYALDDWSATVENKDWLDAIEQQLCDTSQEPQDMSIIESSALFVSHRELKLIQLEFSESVVHGTDIQELETHPDGRVNGQTLVAHCFKRNRPGDGLQELPEACENEL